MNKFDGIEEVRDAQTAEQMRAEIFRLAHYDPLVKNCMDAADYQGSSAEDRYTLLAYHALRERNQACQQILRCLELTAISQPMKSEEHKC